MSYKSYAQPGQFGTYYIDLPIKAEINEDLRAAGDFAQQMELSQKYREKWAGSYLSALNQKSSIERQNRDDNFEFLQNNFKRIFEGEQREFAGRRAELEREIAERRAKEAEPGTLEKVVGFMQAALQIAGTVEGLVSEYQNIQYEQDVEAASISMEKLSAAGVNFTGDNLNNWRETLTNGSSQEIGLRTLREQHPELQTVADRDIINVALGDGRIHQAMIARSYQQSGARDIQTKLWSRTAPGSGDPIYDPTLHQNLDGANGYNEKVRQLQRELRNEWYGEGDIPSEFLLGVVIPEENKNLNSLAARNSEIWGKQAAVENKQLEADGFNSVEIMPNPVESLQSKWESLLNINGGNANKAAQAVFDHVTSNRNLISAGTYGTWVDNLISSRPHPPGGEVQQKLQSARAHLQKQGFQNMNRLTTVNEAKEEQKLIELKSEITGATPAQAAAFREKIRTTDWSEASPRFQKEVMNLATPLGQRRYVSPTWSESTGIADSKLEKSIDTFMLGKVSAGAYFNENGKTEAIADDNYQLARGIIKAEVMRVWGETEKNFPAHVGNKDIILQKAIGQAVENLLEGPAPKLSLDNVDLADPTKPIRFNVGKVFQDGTTTADFYNTIKPFKETKTIPKGQFPELRGKGRDAAMFDRFNTLRSRVKGGPVEIEHVMAIANSQWATEVSEFLGITKFEAVDQGLRSRGHEGLSKANMVTSAQAGIIDRRVADYVDGAKTINETSLQIRADALNRTLGSKPASHVRQASSPMQFGSAQGWTLDPQSPGIDVYPVSGNHVVSPFPDGVVVEKGYDYKPGGTGGDGRPGVGLGNWLKVQHTDPTSGEKFDAVYAHFPNGELDGYQVGSRIPQNHRIGLLATEEQFDNRSDGVGSGRGVHQSMDFYKPGTWSGYHNIPNLVNYIKSLGRQ